MAQTDGATLIQPIGAAPPGDDPPHRPLLLFLPGLSGNLSQWDLVVDLLAGVDADLAYGVAILPHPGLHGARPTVTHVVDAIAAELVAAGRTDVVVVSHSVGSFVALGLARRLPSVVRGVVLVNGGLTTVARFLDHPVREMFERPRTCLTALKLFALVSLPSPEPVKRAIAHHDWSLRTLMGGLVSAAAFRTQRQRTSLMGESGRPLVLRSLWDNRHHWDEFLGYVTEITVPVHFLIGSSDPISGERDTRDMAALLKTADVCVLPGIGHAAPLETARAVADALCRALVESR